MQVYNLLITIFWVIFLAVWLLSAFGAKKNASNNPLARRSALIRILIVVVLVILFSQGRVSNWIIQHPGFTAYAGIELLGVILCGLGIALAIWARFYIGKNWGMPMSIKEEPELVTSGPYKYVRHPIYSGAILAILGSALVTGPLWLIFFVFFAIYFIYSARNEEKYLMQTFPNQYPAYKQRTKMLIPFVY